MTSPLLVRPSAPDADGATVRVTPATAGWRHIGFALFPLPPGGTLDDGEPERETCVVLVSGHAEIVVENVSLGTFGGRTTPFADEPPGAAYIPAGRRFTLRAVDDCQVALCTAPGLAGDHSPRLIGSADMPCEVRGHGSNTRYVRNILPETAPANALLVVEVRTPGGHWSSYPPHKHDIAEAGIETALEEIYFHRVSPAAGFVVQRVYDDTRTLDETIAAHDGDLVLVPRGYHPVGVPPGYESYYLNVMAGPERRWQFRNDPAHDWLASAQATS